MAVKRVILGEQRLKFEQAALPHLDAVYTAALRLARNPDDAEDLLRALIQISDPDTARRLRAGVRAWDPEPCWAAYLEPLLAAADRGPGR